MTTKGSPFSATSSMLGYLFQVRVALLWSLQKLKKGNSYNVSIETLDDVAFTDLGENPIDLLQTKHHTIKRADLTDASEDLWKTLRIWFENALSGKYPDEVNLTLLTTSEAQPGSIASYLSLKNRDIIKAQKMLYDVAKTSSNATNAQAYRVFLDTIPEMRDAILERVLIVCNAPSIGSLQVDLLEEVYWATEKKFQEHFLERLEGWWYQKVIAQLIKNNSSISSEEIESKMNDLRNQFKLDSLPIDDDLLSLKLGDDDNIAYIDFKFVKQLQLVEANQKRIAAAIREYYKAFEQRSRWLRNDLVMVDELKKYEETLKQEWEIVFNAMIDEIGEEATNEIKLKAARKVLYWAETKVIPIRANVTASFITRGSLQILADELAIGWHPDFITLLAAILKPEVVND